MKSLLLFCIAFTYGFNSYGDCSGAALNITFPTSGYIKQNSIFVLEGYGTSQDIINQLNSKHPAYLKSGNKKIKLVVNEICIGQFQLTQAILSLEEKLPPGLEFTLFLDGLDNKFSHYNNNSGKWEAITFTTTSETDNKP